MIKKLGVILVLVLTFSFLASIVYAGNTDVIINEIMYNPFGTDNGNEWIEVFNNGTNSINISTWKFFEGGITRDLTFIRGDGNISAGEFVVIAEKSINFSSNYPWYIGDLFETGTMTLNDAGELIGLNDTTSLVNFVNYSSATFGGSDGFSIELRNLSKAINDSSNWGTTKYVNGTPGLLNTLSDIIPPSFTFISKPVTGTTGEAFLVNITGFDNLGVIFANITIDGAIKEMTRLGNLSTIGNFSFNFTIKVPDVLANIVYNVTLYDLAGNKNTTEAVTMVVSDNDFPLVTLNSPTAKIYTSNILVNATVTDNIKVDKVSFRAENSTFNSSLSAMTNISNDWNATFNIAQISDGNYTIRINATDSSNNTNSSVTVEIRIDRTPPLIINLTKIPLISFNNDSVNLTANITDISGVDKVILQSNYNGSLINYSVIIKIADIYVFPIVFNFTNQQNVSFKWVANDTLGNLGGVESSFKVQNRAPLFLNTTNLTWAEDTTLELNLSRFFFDEDKDNLTFTSTSPINISVVFNQSIAKLIPTANFTGISFIQLSARDIINTTKSNNMTINITNLNDQPVVTSTPKLNATEGLLYIYDVDAIDIDPTNDTIVFNLTNAPTGMKINSTTGIITWIPEFSQRGINAVTLIANDSMDFAVQSFNITTFTSLDLIDIDINIDGITKKVKSGEIIQNVMPGANLTIEVDILNRLEILIEDIKINTSLPQFTISAISDRFNLDTSQIKQRIFKFSLPKILTAGVYDIFINASGKDTSNAQRIADVILQINITKGRHNIEIDKVEFTLKNFSCVRSANLSVALTNIGTESEDDVNLTINSTQLNIFINELIGLVSSNTEVTKRYIVNISSNIPKGNYQLTNAILYNNLENKSTKTSTITVDSCTIPDISIDEDTTPQENLIDLWSVIENGLAYNYQIANQSNATLINCSIITNRYVNCSLPKQDQFGLNTLNLSITTNSGYIAYDLINVTIKPVNDAPIVSGIPDVIFLEDTFNDTIDLDDFVSDVDNLKSELSWSVLNNTNITVTINTITHIANISAQPNFNGTETILFKAVDLSGLGSNDSVIIKVLPVNDAPIITTFFPKKDILAIAEGAEQIFNITSRDPENDQIIIEWAINKTNISNDNKIVISQQIANSNNINGTIYNITVKVNDTLGANITKSWILIITNTPKSDKFSGSIFSFNISQKGNATNATKINIIEPNFGTIDFGNNIINLTNLVDIDTIINISKGIIAIDTATLPQFNKSAKLIMKGLGFKVTPKIFFSSGFSPTGNTECPSTICSNINYDVPSGTLNFNVSQFSTYFVSVENNAPIVNAGPDQSAEVNKLVTLDGSASIDPEASSLIFKWSQLSGQSVSLSSTSVQRPTFTPNSTGSYVFQLIVNDGSLDSLPDNISVNVRESQTGKVLDITNVKLESDDKDSELKPGEKLTVKVDIKNKGNIDIEDIELKVFFETSSGSKLEDDDGDEIEEESEFDLDEGDDEDDLSKDDVEFTFDMPFDVDDGDKFIVHVTAEGEAANDSKLKFSDSDTSKTIEFTKDKHEILIFKSSISPNSIKCERVINIDVGIRNIGEDDEKTELTISSPELGISERQEFELEEDVDEDKNIYRKAFAYKLKDDLTAGTYTIPINVAFREGSKTETKQISLIVEDCERLLVKKKPLAEDVEVRVTPAAKKPSVKPTKTAVKPQVTKIKFRDTSAYLILLASSFIIISLVVVGLAGVWLVRVRR